MKTQPLTPEARLELIKRVSEKAFKNTESWRSEDGLGATLAYLFWAISDQDPESHVDFSTVECGPALVLFRSWFPTSDPVWKFIKTRE
jgi:hypothetical protein